MWGPPKQQAVDSASPKPSKHPTKTRSKDLPQHSNTHINSSSRPSSTSKSPKDTRTWLHRTSQPLRTCSSQATSKTPVIGPSIQHPPPRHRSPIAPAASPPKKARKQRDQSTHNAASPHHSMHPNMLTKSTTYNSSNSSNNNKRVYIMTVKVNKRNN